MSYLTKEERLVLTVLVVVLFCGSLLQYVFKRYPHIHNIVNVVESETIYPKVNLNTASARELKEIPYIGEYTANNIVEYREQNGPFSSIEEIKKVKGIRDKNYERFFKFLSIK